MVETKSEHVLTELFQSFLFERRPHSAVAGFDAVFRELSATVGVADIVGLSCPRWPQTAKQIAHFLGGAARGPSAEIISRLSSTRTRKEEFIYQQSNYSRPVVSAALQALIETGLIYRYADGRLKLTRLIAPKAEIVFFELKIEKWKRALYQALQASEYASRCYCVFPSSKRKVILTNKEKFSTAGVGVLLFDISKWKLTEVIKARKNKGWNERKRIDLIFRLSDISLKAAKPKRKTAKMPALNLLVTTPKSQKKRR